MMTFACVLRSGGDFTGEWVVALRNGLRDSARGDLRVVCLSDLDLPDLGPLVQVESLDHGLPGWWSKMELFRPEIFDEDEVVCYLDLDSLPVGDLTVFGSFQGDLALLSDFYRPALGQSGVLLFRPGEETTRLWELWSSNPPRWMRRFRGDGEWLHRHADHPSRIQALYPGKVVSLKVHARQGPPRGAILVCGHGKPRLSHHRAGWAHEEWQRRIW